MDEAKKRAHIRLRLNKAREDLRTARDNVSQGHFRASVNRAYYTMFHTASAALLWHEIERARHTGVQGAFGEHFIKPGIIDPEYGKMYSRARKLREEQDYDVEAVPITALDAEQTVQDAERFINRVERYLREQGIVE